MDIKYLFEFFPRKENIWFEYLPGLWVAGGHCKVVEHEVQKLSCAIHFREQLQHIRPKRVALNKMMKILFWKKTQPTLRPRVASWKSLPSS